MISYLSCSNTGDSDCFGHNFQYMTTVATMDALTDSEYQDLVDEAEDMMFLYTKELDKKWGDTGIIA